METALVIGGTGPTGPLIVNGLTRRGYKVTILHTGRHETDLISDEVEHIHTNPFDRNASAEAIGTRTFDLGVVMYGRLRDLVELLAGKIGHLVTIGGVGVYHGFANPDDLFPEGLPVPNPSSAELVGDNEYFKSKINFEKNDNTSFSFETKRNLITNSSEYYNLSYEYLNDCLRAGLVYRREFYKDSELEPENSLMFKITLVPFGQLDSPSIN